MGKFDCDDLGSYGNVFLKQPDWQVGRKVTLFQMVNSPPPKKDDIFFEQQKIFQNEFHIATLAFLHFHSFFLKDFFA